MIQAQRLLKLLAPSGFELGWHSRGTLELCFVRPDRVSGVWQRARLHCGTTAEGKHRGVRGDAVGEVGLGISAVRSEVNPLGLQQEQCDDDATVFMTADDAMRWERAFSERVPGMLDSLSLEVGPRVEASTRAVRSAVDAYEALLGFGTTITELETWLEAQATASQRVAADRIGSGAAYVPGGVSLYRLVALALVVLRERVEPAQPDYAAVRSAVDLPELGARMELLVDRLLLPARRRGPLELV